MISEIEKIKQYFEHNSIKIEAFENMMDLFDYGNEYVFTIRTDYIDSDCVDYEIQTTQFETFAKKLQAKCDGEWNTGDYICVLESAFNTNNHFIFIISMCK